MKKLRSYLAQILLAFALLIHPLGSMAISDEAIFAGGCFWCLEHDLESLSGVISAESGYTGGDLAKPSYEYHKGHQEAVLVRFESSEISYDQLLRSYLRNIDPLDVGGQFCDRGESYKPVIFTKDQDQEMKAISSLNAAAIELGKPNSSIKVQILNAKRFWLAEDYHQNYAENNRLKYNFYRYSCGRDARLEQLWGAKARSNQDFTKYQQSTMKTLREH